MEIFLEILYSVLSLTSNNNLWTLNIIIIIMTFVQPLSIIHHGDFLEIFYSVLSLTSNNDTCPFEIIIRWIWILSSFNDDRNVLQICSPFLFYRKFQMVLI